MNSFAIDTDTYVGHFPYRKLFNNNLESLANLAKQNDIDTMCVSSLNAVFYRNCQDGNDELYDEFEEYKKNHSDIKFLPFAVINPHYIGHLHDIDKNKANGFCGIELVPLYHSYRLGDDESVAAVKYAASKGMPVRIRACFEDSRQRHDLDIQTNVCPKSVADLICKAPEAHYILTGFYASDIYPYINENKNVFFSSWKEDIYPAINPSFLDDISSVPTSQFVLGTNAPFSYIEPELLRLLNCKNLSDEEKNNILRNNIEKIL